MLTSPRTPCKIKEDVIKQMADTLEQRKMQELMQDIKQKIEQSQTLQKFKDQLLIDITDEGLRIQIVDRSKRPMFDSGSAELKYYSEDLLFELAKPLSKIDNKISITGHTDATPYVGRPGYTNWELSADRANTARRALVAGGVRPEQIARVEGFGDSVLFDREHPQAPINRRISIIVLNKKTMRSIEKNAGAQGRVLDATGEAAPAQPAPTAEQQNKATQDLQQGNWLNSDRKRDPAGNEVQW